MTNSTTPSRLPETLRGRDIEVRRPSDGMSAAVLRQHTGNNATVNKGEHEGAAGRSCTSENATGAGETAKTPGHVPLLKNSLNGLITRRSQVQILPPPPNEEARDHNGSGPFWFFGSFAEAAECQKNSHDLR